MEDSELPRSRPSVSIATLTIVVSRIDMIVPSTTTEASRNRARSRPWGSVGMPEGVPTTRIPPPRYAARLRAVLDHPPRGDRPPPRHAGAGGHGHWGGRRQHRLRRTGLRRRPPHAARLHRRHGG